ncbi:MAG: hypothetical protein NVS9B8_03170 [Candidatus Limnocylindrales bacterium]
MAAPKDRREPDTDVVRRGGMPLHQGHGPSRAIVVLVLTGLFAGCTGAASSNAGASSSPAVSAAGSATASPGGGPLSDASAKEALIARFGPLVYCDPDLYPVARADEARAATEHLSAMRADSATWAAIAAHLSFDARSAPTGDALLTAYREWKMLRALVLTPTADGWSFDARFGGTGPNASVAPAVSHVAGSITANGVIRVDTNEPGAPPPCPICLARGTRIATPIGEIAVDALRVGDPVWTIDGIGRRVRAIIIEVGSTPVPAGHEVVRLVLADGRTVLVSPGHPLPDGRPVGGLRTGDVYDRSVVVSADRIPYDGGRTFDLLPSGGTGVYWANGIELGSTFLLGSAGSG